MGKLQDQARQRQVSPTRTIPCNVTGGWKRNEGVAAEAATFFAARIQIEANKRSLQSYAAGRTGPGIRFDYPGLFVFAQLTRASFVSDLY